MGASVVRGIRGAINVSKNSKSEIIQATTELLTKMAEENNLKEDAIISIFFTLTPDLNAAFPAAAARELGWNDVPLLGAVEVDVPEALAFCIRVLMLVNTDWAQNEVKHVYLREACSLRVDLVNDNT